MGDNLLLMGNDCGRIVFGGQGGFWSGIYRSMGFRFREDFREIEVGIDTEAIGPASCSVGS